jgi:transposase
MAEPDARTRCPECTRLRARIAELEAQLAAARKHSGNSSKPPSSDIVKPPKAGPVGPDGKRRRGGQRGHPRYERPAFPPEQVDQTHEYTLGCCPDCGGTLEDTDAAPRVLQQVEVVEKPIRIEEHRGLASWCPTCQRLHYGPLPQELTKAGLVGPRLTALVAFLKGACHASFSTIRKFLRDVVGVTISRGQLAKLVQKVSASLKSTYDELVAALPQAARLNVDETGHPDQGDRLWTWCFRASLYTLFKIDPSRGSEVLVEVLGREFNGLLGCDYFSAYRKYMDLSDAAVQFCLAHFLRDVKFLVEHPNAANRRYGQMLLGHLRRLFGIIHHREAYASAASFRRALAAVRNALLADAITELVDTPEAENLADRLACHGDCYFRFITEPDIDPTNNVAEQAVRFVAIQRRLTQGTRGDAGQRWCERLWTVVATCAQQGRSVFRLLYDAVQAYLRGAPAPSLLPDSG